MIGLFKKMKKAFQDKTRYAIWAGLRNQGIRSHIAQRGRTEEETGVGSLGLIDVLEGPIRWVNVRRVSTYMAPSGGSISYVIDYGVTDSKLEPNSPRLEIRSVRKKSFPIFGRVIDLRWEGNDAGLGIVSRLNTDKFIKRPIMESLDVAIYADGGYRCWIISSQTSDCPSRELWDCYETIARHLLESSGK